MNYSPEISIAASAPMAGPYFNATDVLSSLQASSEAEIDLITIVGDNHETAGIPCILGMIDWINQFR